MSQSKAGLLIAIGGLSGSGKSALATSLTRAYERSGRGVTVVATDTVRRELAGVKPGEKLPVEFYSSAFFKKTYEEVNRRINEALEEKQVVIADATFIKEAARRDIEETAWKAQALFVRFWLDAPENILKARVASREKGLSDADASVIDLQLGIDQGVRNWPVIDASRSAGDVCWDAIKILGAEGLAPRVQIKPRRPGFSL